MTQRHNSLKKKKELQLGTNIWKISASLTVDTEKNVQLFIYPGMKIKTKMYGMIIL